YAAWLPASPAVCATEHDAGTFPLNAPVRGYPAKRRRRVATVVERMVRIGGVALFLECTGSGTPLGVISPRMLGAADNWADIQRTVAPLTTVVGYDRAGLGQSEPRLISTSAPSTSPVLKNSRGTV